MTDFGVDVCGISRVSGFLCSGPGVSELNAVLNLQHSCHLAAALPKLISTFIRGLTHLSTYSLKLLSRLKYH